MVGEDFTLLLHKAVQERERDEAEEYDKENSAADHSLGLRAVAQQHVRWRGEKAGRGRGHSLMQAVPSLNLAGKGTTTGIPDAPKGPTFPPPSLPQY